MAEDTKYSGNKADCPEKFVWCGWSHVFVLKVEHQGIQNVSISFSIDYLERERYFF
jgi:hypothetical protein